MESPPKESEERTFPEIHTIEVESNKQNLVVTSEQSHTERTEETIEKPDTESTIDEIQASIENGLSEAQSINEDLPSQAREEDTSKLEEQPTCENNCQPQQPTENCQEPADGHNDVSEMPKEEGESGAVVESNARNDSSGEKEEEVNVSHASNDLECSATDLTKDEHKEDTKDEQSEDLTEKSAERERSPIEEPVEEKSPQDIDDPKESTEETLALEEQDKEIEDKTTESIIAEPETTPESGEQSEKQPDIPQSTEDPDDSLITEETAVFHDPVIAVEMGTPQNKTEIKEPSDKIDETSASNLDNVQPEEPRQETQNPPIPPSVSEIATPALQLPQGDTERETSPGSAEIQEENLKSQLHEIIREIDREVVKDEENETAYYANDVGPQHTWKPKKKYEVKKLEIKYEEVVPIKLADVKFSEHKKEEAKKVAPKEKPKQPIPPPKPKKQSEVNGDPLTPVEIPEGLPLLAKICPKEGEEGSRDKITLERLFTPATDSAGDLTPKKRKIYASSAFYRPDHPTIEDQVDLAHKISVSLIDDENKASKGQSMYMKRKNRSSKWIHAGDFVEEEDLLPPKESKQRPPLKLLMNPKGLHDYTSIQQSYEEMASASQVTHNMNSIEGCKEIISDMQSPTGKGAALFAKRKRRMDKFIVDENSVQKSASSSTITQQNSIQSSLQEEIQSITNSLSMLPPSIESTSAGSLILPDITKILTQPKPFDKKSSKTKPGPKGKSIKREYSWNISTSKKEVTPTKKPGFYNPTPPKSTFNYDIDLRPGTPPLFVISDQKGNLLDKSANYAFNSISTANQIHDEESNSDGGAIYKAEVSVVQSPSIPATPILELPSPQDVHLDRLSSDSLEDKRKSFNLAAKGWGTYADYYTPLHLSTT